MRRGYRYIQIGIILLILTFMPFRTLLASMTFKADDTYLKAAVTVYLPDKENIYSFEMSGPGGTFNKSNAGSCYIEGDGKITINYGYMEKGSSYTLSVKDAGGNDIGQFTFTIKSKTSGNFLVQPPENAATPTPIPSPTPEPTTEPDATPTPVPPIVINTPTTTPSKTPDPTDTPTPTPSNTPVPTETPSPSDTPTPTETPSPVPTEEPTETSDPTATPIPTEEMTTTENQQTEQEPSETEQIQEPEEKSDNIVDKIEDVAVNIPGIYKTKTGKTVRVKQNVAIASIIVAFLIGFCIMFVIRLAKESKRISTEEFFRGTLGTDDQYIDEDDESEE